MVSTHSTATPFAVRVASAADIPLLESVNIKAAALFPTDRIPQPVEGVAVSLLEQAVQQELLLVAEVDSSVVGFALCESQDDSLHLAQLSVLPEQGRQGIGRGLLEAVLQLASDRHHQRVTLTTFSDIRWNGPFYASAGFRQLAKHELSDSLQSMIAGEEALGMYNRIAMERLLSEH